MLLLYHSTSNNRLDPYLWQELGMIDGFHDQYCGPYQGQPCLATLLGFGWGVQVAVWEVLHNRNSQFQKANGLKPYKKVFKLYFLTVCWCFKILNSPSVSLLPDSKYAFHGLYCNIICESAHGGWGKMAPNFQTMFSDASFLNGNV